MKFGAMMEVHHSGLYVTEKHEEWLKNNPNPVYSQEAMEFAQETFSTPQRDRTQSFSASAMGGCPRATQFQFLGLPQARITNATTINIFHTGNYIHLKWQMAGLTAGWLKEAEPFLDDTVRWLKGSMDGILDNGWGLEIKSINSNGYKRVLTYGGKKEHLRQIDSYFLMRPDIPKFSLLYENKDTGDYKEIVVDRDQERLDALEAQLMVMKRKTQDHEYFDMRDDCWKGEGTMFRYCPYARICKEQGMSW